MKNSVLSGWAFVGFFCDFWRNPATENVKTAFLRLKSGFSFVFCSIFMDEQRKRKILKYMAVAVAGFSVAHYTC